MGGFPLSKVSFFQSIALLFPRLKPPSFFVEDETEGSKSIKINCSIFQVSCHFFFNNHVNILNTYYGNIGFQVSKGWTQNDFCAQIKICMCRRESFKIKLLISKGQLISKGLFVFNSSKKRTKNFCPSRLGQKLKISSSFFGRMEDTQISFRD